MTRPGLSKESALLLAGDLLLRERLDAGNWDLRQMRLNVLQLKKVVGTPLWKGREKAVWQRLSRSIDELEEVIREKDATRVDAAHTHVEEAFSELREVVFGV